MKSFFLFTFLILLVATSCSENYRHPDKTYFMALRAVEKNDEKEARRLFLKGVKDCSPVAARKCAENLVSLGNVRERNEAALNLLKNFCTPKNAENYNSVLIAVRELAKNSEHSAVIKATDDLSIEDLDVSNELIRIRLCSLQKKQFYKFENEFQKYFLTRNIDLDAISEILKNPDSLAEEDPFFNFRLLVARKQYSDAFSKFNDLMDFSVENGFYPQIISDMGKAALYGADNFENAAYKFESLLKKMQFIGISSVDKNAQYNAHFYAGRLYSKAGNFSRATKTHFTAAMDLARDDASRYDNALWYLLNSTLSVSTADAITLIEEYAPLWHDAKYFDDIFNPLLVMLLSNRNYEKIASTYLATKDFLSEETKGKYAYISGRLIQEKLIESSMAGITASDDLDAKTFFQDALNCGGDSYYKIMAATRLKLSMSEFEKAMLTTATSARTEPAESASETTTFDSLLSGYEIFGFPQKIYPEWISNRDKISPAAAFKAATFLENCDEEKNNFGQQGIRIAARTTAETKEQLRLAYPQFFKNEIIAAAEKNGLPSYEIFALVRSESFFDPKVRSKAGAIGLTQLMETTATDVARKLKVSDFDLSHLDDPKTNIDFGTFYLAELTGRIENQKILGLYSYNAGISNVRRWTKNIRADYLKTSGPLYKTTGIAPDLFLEMIPFEETRGYGRKLVSASVIYGWLYEDLSPSQIVNEIFD